MTRHHLKLALPVIVAVAFAVALFACPCCYKGDPPCNPGSVDYPRCDPTQPSWATRADGGRG
jgi:hypothetical protein